MVKGQYARLDHNSKEEYAEFRQPETDFYGL